MPYDQLDQPLGLLGCVLISSNPLSSGRPERQTTYPNSIGVDDDNGARYKIVHNRSEVRFK